MIGLQKEYISLSGVIDGYTVGLYIIISLAKCRRKYLPIVYVI